MAIEQGLAASFALELFQGVHDFTNDTLKLALYDSNASLSPDTTAYSTTNEVSGTGYTAGGATMVFAESTPKLDSTGRVVLIGFDDVTWTGLTVSDIRAGLIYNSSQSNKAVAVLDFGGSISRTGQAFTVPSPLIDANSALIRAIATGNS